MLAAERGAAANTLTAYRRDLEGADELLGSLAEAEQEDLARLAVAQQVVRVREPGAERDRAGLVVEVGLDRLDHALLPEDLAVGHLELHRHCVVHLMDRAVREVLALV